MAAGPPYAPPAAGLTLASLRQAYMEDHLRNRDRLAKEWQALCAYQAEPSVCSIAQSEANLKKNRNPDYVPCEHPSPWGTGMLGAKAGCSAALPSASPDAHHLPWSPFPQMTTCGSS